MSRFLDWLLLVIIVGVSLASLLLCSSSSVGSTELDSRIEGFLL